MRASDRRLSPPSSNSLQQIEPALPAILGQRSEHSLATGPVIPDPFISPLGFTMTPALSKKTQPFMLNRARRIGLSPTINRLIALVLTLEVKEMAFSSADGLALTNNDSSKHLLSKLGLTLLD